MRGILVQHQTKAAYIQFWWWYYELSNICWFFNRILSVDDRQPSLSTESDWWNSQNVGHFSGKKIVKYLKKSCHLHINNNTTWNLQKMIKRLKLHTEYCCRGLLYVNKHEFHTFTYAIINLGLVQLYKALYGHTGTLYSKIPVKISPVKLYFANSHTTLQGFFMCAYL